jgi:hypothetical protein
VKLLLDEMLSAGIAEQVRGRGHNAVAVDETPELRGLADPDLFAQAQDQERAIVQPFALALRQPRRNPVPAARRLIAQPSSPRTSSAVRLLANRSPSSMTPLNSAALRRARAATFSSIVSREIIR